MRHNPTSIPTQTKRIPDDIQKEDKNHHDDRNQEYFGIVQMRYVSVPQMCYIKIIHKCGRIYRIGDEECKKGVGEDDGEEEVLDDV